jgi:threonylcarbamoyladenosine tRNA methylthiotransferase MtaB
MYLHSFSYSERRNTDSVNIPGKVEINKIKERGKILRNISVKKRYDFYGRFLDTKQKVLFETKRDDGYIEGYTANYMRVRIKADKTEDNVIKEVMLKEIVNNKINGLMDD